MATVTIRYDNGNVEEIEANHIIVIADSKGGDFDFHGTNSPEFIKRIEQVHGLQRYRRYLMTGMVRSK